MKKGDVVEAALRIMLWPLAFIAFLMDDCYSVFWYCVVIGRPAWMCGHKAPIREVAELFGRTDHR